MSLTLPGALAAATALGMTHAVEPDHVVGIASLTGRYGDSRLSALAGACFSLGHVLLVVLWLAVGYVLLGRTEFPPVLDAVGTVGVGAVLGLLGMALALGGLRRLRSPHSHAHDHGDRRHRHVHAHLPTLGGGDHATHEHDHDHGLRTYLETGLVGALFTLSPPLSMIAFAATLFPTLGPGVVTMAVLAYAAGITATMSALGAGVGVFAGAVGEVGGRIAGGLRILAGLVVVGFATSLLLGTLPI